MQVGALVSPFTYFNVGFWSEKLGYKEVDIDLLYLEAGLLMPTIRAI